MQFWTTQGAKMISVGVVAVAFGITLWEIIFGNRV